MDEDATKDPFTSDDSAELVEGADIEEAARDLDEDDDPMWDVE